MDFKQTFTGKDNLRMEIIV